MAPALTSRSRERNNQTEEAPNDQNVDDRQLAFVNQAEGVSENVNRRYEMLPRGIGTVNFMPPSSAQIARAVQIAPPISKPPFAKMTVLICVGIPSLLSTVAWVTFLAWTTWSLF